MNDHNNDLQRRRWLKQVAAASMLTAGGVSGLIRDVLAAGNTPIAQVAPGMARMSGEVTINGKPAALGMLVGPGDTVVTGPGAEAVYVIGQDAFLQRGMSTVAFGADAAKQFMRVVTGKLLSVFGKGTPRVISVSTATIGIRGTGCYIEDSPAPPPRAGGSSNAMRPHSVTYFCLCYGDVEVAPKATPDEITRYQTRHHDHPIEIYDDMNMPTKMIDASVINHTDAELIMLESLVGRKAPFDSASTWWERRY